MPTAADSLGIQPADLVNQPAAPATSPALNRCQPRLWAASADFCVSMAALRTVIWSGVRARRLGVVEPRGQHFGEQLLVERAKDRILLGGGLRVTRLARIAQRQHQPFGGLGVGARLQRHAEPRLRTGKILVRVGVPTEELGISGILGGAGAGRERLDVGRARVGARLAAGRLADLAAQQVETHRLELGAAVGEPPAHQQQCRRGPPASAAAGWPSARWRAGRPACCRWSGM